MSDPRLSRPSETPSTPAPSPGEDLRESSFILNGRAISEPILASPDTKGLSSAATPFFVGVVAGVVAGERTPSSPSTAAPPFAGAGPTDRGLVRRRARRALRSTRAAARAYTAYPPGPNSRTSLFASAAAVARAATASSSLAITASIAAWYTLGT